MVNEVGRSLDGWRDVPADDEAWLLRQAHYHFNENARSAALAAAAGVIVLND
ncbi:hypothetical protein [Bradyrhizobium sp. USDA 4452]